MTALCLMKELSLYLTGGFAAFTIVILIRLCFVPQNNRPRKGHYSMPWVPILPAFGIFFNFTLACSLDGTTWMLFGIFLAIGLVVYFSYGIWNSKLEADNVMRDEFEHSIVTEYN